jgi:UDP-N-acetylglucosamine 2-epimerase (non-hydrolysing)
VKIALFCGARPNFIKAYPMLVGLEQRGHSTHFCMTGQHRDPSMTTTIMREIGMREWDTHLTIDNSKSRACRHSEIVNRTSDLLGILQPDCALVVGDVDSTWACAQASLLCGVPVVHLEAGLRSHDPRMPEEYNRVLTDHVSSLLLCSYPEALRNLQREGFLPDSVNWVGNTMIDTLRAYEHALTMQPLSEYGLMRDGYAVCTFHRPENVDDPKDRQNVSEALAVAAEHATGGIVVVRHPRLHDPIPPAGGRVVHVEAMSYLRFLSLVKYAKFVVTDSGGVQEETMALGTKCFTLRQSTERLTTINEGTNDLTPGAGDLAVALGNWQREEELGIARRAVDIPSHDGKSWVRAVDEIEGWWSER